MKKSDISISKRSTNFRNPYQLKLQLRNFLLLLKSNKLLYPTAAELIYFSLFMSLLYMSGSSYLGDFDAGEFYHIAIGGGIAHPPGYPIYNFINQCIYLMTKSLSLIPYWGINVLFTVFSAWFCYRYILHEKYGINSLLSLSIVFLTPTIWRSATNIEPFALHHLLVILAMTMASKIDEYENESSYWFAWGLIFGLALCHHHIFAMLLPGTLWCLRKSFTYQRFGQWIFGSMLGVLPLSYFYFAQNGSYVFGNWSDFTTALFQHILRTNYGTFKLSVDSQPNFLIGQKYFLFSFIENMGWPILFFIIYGTYTYFKSSTHKAFGVWLLWGLLFSGPIFYGLVGEDYKNDFFSFATRFLGTSYLLAIPFLAKGLKCLGKRELIYGIIFILYQAIYQLPVNFRTNEKFTEHNIHNIVKTVAFEGNSPAIVVTHYDNESMGFKFYKSKYGLPKNFRFVHKPLWPAEWYQKQFTNKLKFSSIIEWLQYEMNQGTRIYSTVDTKINLKNFTEKIYPIGALVRILPSHGQMPSSMENFKNNLELLESFPNSYINQKSHWDDVILRDYYNKWNMLSIHLKKDEHDVMAKKAYDIAKLFLTNVN